MWFNKQRVMILYVLPGLNVYDASILQISNDII